MQGEGAPPRPVAAAAHWILSPLSAAALLRYAAWRPLLVTQPDCPTAWAAVQPVQTAPISMGRSSCVSWVDGKGFLGSRGTMGGASANSISGAPDVAPWASLPETACHLQPPLGSFEAKTYRHDRGVPPCDGRWLPRASAQVQDIFAKAFLARVIPRHGGTTATPTLGGINVTRAARHSAGKIHAGNLPTS